MSNHLLVSALLMSLSRCLFLYFCIFCTLSHWLSISGYVCHSLSLYYSFSLSLCDCRVGAHQCDQMGDLLHFGQLFKAWCNNYFCPNRPHLGNFCKVVKKFHFSSEINFGQLFLDIWLLFTGHTGKHKKENFEHQIRKHEHQQQQETERHLGGCLH